MKSTRKILTLLLAAVMLLTVFTACGSKNEETSDNTTPGVSGAPSSDGSLNDGEKKDTYEPVPEVVDMTKGYYETTLNGTDKYIFYHFYPNGIVYIFGLTNKVVGTYEVVAEAQTFTTNGGARIDTGEFDYSALGVDCTMGKNEKGETTATVTTDSKIVVRDMGGEVLVEVPYDSDANVLFDCVAFASAYFPLKQNADRKNSDYAAANQEQGYPLSTFLGGSETEKVEICHDGTYVDALGEFEVYGTWTMMDGVYTLTPDDPTEKGATLKADGDKGIFTYDGGTAQELTLVVPVAETLYEFVSGEFEMDAGASIVGCVATMTLLDGGKAHYEIYCNTWNMVFREFDGMWSEDDTAITVYNIPGDDAQIVITKKDGAPVDFQVDLTSLLPGLIVDMPAGGAEAFTFLSWSGLYGMMSLNFINNGTYTVTAAANGSIVQSGTWSFANFGLTCIPDGGEAVTAYPDQEGGFKIALTVPTSQGDTPAEFEGSSADVALLSDPPKSDEKKELLVWSGMYGMMELHFYGDGTYEVTAVANGSTVQSGMWVYENFGLTCTPDGGSAVTSYPGQDGSFSITLTVLTSQGDTPAEFTGQSSDVVALGQ